MSALAYRFLEPPRYLGAWAAFPWRTKPMFSQVYWGRLVWQALEPPPPQALNELAELESLTAKQVLLFRADYRCENVCWSVYTSPEDRRAHDAVQLFILAARLLCLIAKLCASTDKFPRRPPGVKP